MSIRHVFHLVLCSCALLGLGASRAAADFLWVSSVGTNSILEYDTAGTLKRTVATASNIDAPFQMAFAPGDTNHLYVAILGTSQVYVVNQTNPNAPTFTPFVSSVTAPNGQPAYPGYIQFDTDPTDNVTYLYVNDFKHNEILRYYGPNAPAGHNPGDPAPSTGQSGAVYVPPNLSQGVLNSPTGFTWANLTATGHTLLAINSNAATNDQIMQFTESAGTVSGHGNFISPSDQKNNLVNGASIHVGPDGNLWVSSFGNNEILEYSLSTGKLLQAFTNATLTRGTGAQLNEPSGFAFHTDASSHLLLYIANPGDNDVLQLDTTANTLSVAIQPNGSLPSTEKFIPIDVQYITSSVTSLAVSAPEPSSLVLLGVGLLSAVAYRLRRRA